MRFPYIETVSLPCMFETLVPGKLHEDGQRYLPQILLRLPEPFDAKAGHVRTLSVVDRHHVVRQEQVGRRGAARLVLLLSTIQLQEPPFRRGLFAEPGFHPDRPSTAPFSLGQVVAVPTWQVEHHHLPYEALSTELILDVGIGTVGVRTNMTAVSLAERIGVPVLLPGDWLAVTRSRVDILAFET
jgi:hypothetical protein